MALESAKFVVMREILEPIAHQLQHPQDLDRVLATVAQRTAESVAAVCTRLWLIRRGDLCQTCHWANDCPDKRRCLHLKANFGAPVETAYRRAPLTVLSGEQLARGGVMAWTPPPSTATMLLDPDVANEQGVVSFITCPLRVENRVLGLLVVFGARLFTQADFELCAVQAAAASTAIRVAELVNRTQRATAAARDKSRELEQQARLLTAILRHSSDRAVVIEDLDGNILAFNEGARRAYGYNPEEVIGQATSEKLHAPDDWHSGQVSKIYQQALENGVYRGEIRRQRKDGHIFVEYTTLTALQDEEGDPAGFIAVAPVGSEGGADRSAEIAAETVLTALDDLVAIRHAEDLIPETLAQMRQLSGAAGAALLVLDGDALLIRAIQGDDAFQAGLLNRRFLLSDAPELFRVLEHGQVEALEATAAKLLATPADGGLVVPMLRQQVRAIVVVAGAPRQAAKPLLRLARLTAALLKWHLLAEQLTAREQALAAAETAHSAQYAHLAQEHEQLTQAQQAAVEQIAALEEQVHHLQTALQDARTAHQAAEAQAAHLEEKLAAVESDRMRLLGLCQEAESSAEQARQTAAETFTRYEALRQEQSALLREHNTLKEQVALESDRHTRTLTRVRELESELEATQQARQAAEQALAEQTQHATATQQQLMERIAHLEARLAEAAQMQAQRAAELDQLSARLAALTEEVTLAQQARLEAQHRAETLCQDLEATQKMLAEAVAHRQTAEHATAEIEERAATLLSEVIASQEEQARLIKDYEAVEAALRTARGEADRQSRRAELLESHVDALERSLTTSEVSRAALAQRLEVLLEERAAWRETIDRLEARLAESHARLSAESDASPTASSSLTQEQITQLQGLLAQREAENTALRQRLNILQGTYRETVAVLQSRLDDLTKLNAITGAHRRLEEALFTVPPPTTTDSPPAGLLPAVIVACDDESLRQTLLAWAQEAGYQTSAVADGDATLAALLLDPPYGIILAGTPAHIGDTYRRIRRNPDWRTLPIVVIKPPSLAGVAASPATVTLEQRTVSPAALRQALWRWSTI